MPPTGASFDDLGRGEDEGKRNFAEPSDDAANRSIDLLKHMASTGYLRNRVPAGLMSRQGGFADPATPFVAAPLAATALASGTVAMDVRVKAKLQGYTGDPCGECGNYTLVRNGTCLKCNTCGGTSGCS